MNDRDYRGWYFHPHITDSLVTKGLKFFEDHILPKKEYRPATDKERVVFAHPIADYQLTRVKLARMAAHLLACRQITYGVADLMDQGSGDMEASGAKLFASRTAEWFTREALQIHGGMGYAEETPVSRYFADARVLSIFEGAEETLALKVITRSLVENAA